MTAQRLAPAGDAPSAEGESFGSVSALRERVRSLERRLALFEQVSPTNDASDFRVQPQELIGRLIDSIDTLVVLLDQQGRILLFNRTSEAITGLRAADVQGRFVWDLFSDENRSRAKAAFSELQRGQFSGDLERFSLLRDGQRRYIQWSSQLLMVCEGEPCVVITGMDITKRHLAERALKSQFQAEQLIGGVSRSLISVTPANVDAGVNEALARLCEFAKTTACSTWLLDSAQEFVRRQHHWSSGNETDKHERYVYPLSAIQWLARRIHAGEIASFESRDDLPPQVSEDIEASEQRWIQAFLATPLVCGGRAIGWMCIESDRPRPWSDELKGIVRVFAEMLAGTLERVRSEEALRASEERMRAVVQNMPVMMLAVDNKPDESAPYNYKIIAWNQECERVTGYRADEVIGNPHAPEFLSPDPMYRAEMHAKWRELGDSFQNQVWKMRAKDGSLKSIAWSNLSGRVPIEGWASWGVGIDVTQQSEAQEALRRAHGELENRVRERTLELSIANEQLVEESDKRERQARILRLVLDNIGDGVAVANENGELVLFNPAGERILGAGATAGPPDNWTAFYGLYLPDAVTPYPGRQLPLYRATMGESSDQVEMYLHNDRLTQGSWLSVTARPMYDSRGTLRGGVAVFRDVTEQKRAREELKNEQRSLRQLLMAHERDRQLLAYEIHDGMVQDVTGAIMHLEAARQLESRDRDRCESEFKLSLRLLRNTIDEARRFISGLRPPILDEQGIVAAIDYLVSEHTCAGGLEIDYRHDFPTQHLDTLLEGTIYRIVQEALSNVRRHSSAERALVSLTQRDGWVQLEIRDFGHGFDPRHTVETRYGLEGIRERARLLRGKAQIESVPGEGTRVYVELPLAPSQWIGKQRLEE